MLSKPLAALLLVIALFGAAVGGAYVAMKVFQPAPSDDDLLLELPGGDAPADGAEPAVTPAGAARSRRPPPVRASQGSGSAASGGVAGAVTAPAGTPDPNAAVTGGAGASAGAGTSPSSSPAQTEPKFEEVEIPTNALLSIRLQAALSSETAQVEDLVEARTTKDVAVRGLVAIPAGALVVGSVTQVDKGGPMSGRARLDVKFHTVKITHAPDVPIVVDVIPQEGPSPAKGTKGRVAGGAAGGAALGWLKGGLSGAITGGAIGGGAGVGARMVEGRQPAEIPAGAETQIQLRAPAYATVQH